MVPEYYITVLALTRMGILSRCWLNMVPEYYTTVLTQHGTGVLSRCWLNMVPEYYITVLALTRMGILFTMLAQHGTWILHHSINTTWNRSAVTMLAQHGTWILHHSVNIKWKRNTVTMLVQLNTHKPQLTLLLARRAASSMLSFHSRASSREGTATSNGVHMVVFWTFRIHSFAGYPPTANSTTAPIISRLPFCKLPSNMESEDWNQQVTKITFILIPSLNTSTVSGFRSSVMWCCVIGQMVPDILKVHSACIFRDQAVFFLNCFTLRQRSHTASEHWEPLTQHSIATQNTQIPSNTAVRISHIATTISLKNNISHSKSCHYMVV